MFLKGIVANPVGCGLGCQLDMADNLLRAHAQTWIWEVKDLVDGEYEGFASSMAYPMRKDVAVKMKVWTAGVKPEW